MKHVIHTTRVARMLGAVAVLACGLTLVVASFFDPFGREGSRIDEAGRDVTAELLCVQIQAFQQRLDGITALEHRGLALSDSDANLKDVLVGGLDRYRIKLGEINRECDPIDPPPTYEEP